MVMNFHFWMLRIKQPAMHFLFIVVKKNVDYQIVGTFVCEGESSENITEVLNISKD